MDTALSWSHALILGLVQGLTEFLPVSSSAHLRIVAALAGWPDPGPAFTAVTQLGTEAAVIVYFARDIAAIMKAWVRSLADRSALSDPNARLGWLVIAGTIPIGVLGLALQSTIESSFRSLWLIAAALIGFALVLGWADRVAANRRPLESLSIRDGLLCGLAQALALIPGVSRSGGTISAALLLGYTRPAAARFSFLLAVPAVVLSGLFELKDLTPGALSAGPVLAATAVAFAVGYAVIAWLLRYLSHGSFAPFVVYRIVAGVAVLGLLGAGAL